MAYDPMRQTLVASALAISLAACSTDKGTDQQVAELEGTKHVCSSCHGYEGRSISPTFPNLAGQQEEYLENQLHAFRDHTRADPHAHTYMWGMAARLGDATITGLAKFYSTQKPADPETADPKDVQAGRVIFENGIDARSVPACQNCHGAQGEGAGAIPRLADQHADYIDAQLNAFASNSRANEMMHENSKNLTPDEARELAAYVSGL